MLHESKSYRIFKIVNSIILFVIALTCLMPMVHLLALSFSSAASATAGEVLFWPVDFTLSAYEFVIDKGEFFKAFFIGVERLVLGSVINMLFIITIAYPLSKETSSFHSRTVYTWIFVFTILFNGGLIPFYMTVQYTGLMNTIWALVIPVAVPVWNIILMMNFFRSLPKELEEASLIDGAGHITTLVRIYLPVSLPGLATVLLFTMVYHWNEWFYGIIFMNRIESYPLASYLQTVVVARNMIKMSAADALTLQKVSDRTVKAAQVFIAMIPILIVYPYLQKYFTKGLVMGSVKG